VRLATISTQQGARLHVRGRSGYVDVASESGRAELSTMQGLLDSGSAGLDLVRTLQSLGGQEFGDEAMSAAVPNPQRILCLGLNYAEHAREGGREAPSWPESFVRGAGSVCGPYADLVRPTFTSGFDYEGELGIVIGQGGRYLSAKNALSAVAGYVVLNDASARDWQRAGSQWTPGKNFDGSMPVGPEMVTPDELDASDLVVTTTLNGQVMQSARTSQMIVDIASSIEFFSSFTTLVPGDLIATGTPGGVGFARKPPVWLEPGDLIEVAIEGIAGTRNRVVAEHGAPTNWRWMPGAPASPVL
jgi:2-keto-4-pentenoate hydratase/2-oxohepta-3-ene-1,7-dioic acid hydratase in catechol pathway